LLFSILKIPSKLALPIYCRNLIVNKKEILSRTGPLLIASNHPNSFLDAIILATIFKRPVYSLARGDSFKNKLVSKILYGINILPVYRLSEGAENLNSNYDTFAKCRDIFRKNGIVLIFSEGLCVNEWKLRSLKKGTARLAFSSWQEGIDVTVLPTGINYHSFKKFGKNVQLKFGQSFGKEAFYYQNMDGNGIKHFNEKLKIELTELVETIDHGDIEKLKSTFEVKHNLIKKKALFLPALIGKWIHAPLYIPIRNFTKKNAGKSDHFDSILVGLLFMLYPMYLTAIAAALYLWLGSWYWLLTFVTLPLLAWSYTQLRKQF
jgi:1-acyl-sn-glycerol-3-phosphate acyltransferase